MADPNRNYELKTSQSFIEIHFNWFSNLKCVDPETPIILIFIQGIRDVL